MALYKKNEDGSWLKADEYVMVPVKITKENPQQGWTYHENDPEEYTTWVNSQVPPQLSMVEL